MEWLILGFLNLIFAFINLCIQMIQGQVRKGVVVSLFMLFCPLVGPLLVVMAWLLQKMLFRKGSDKLNLEELSFKKERVSLVVAADVDAEVQKVPVEEALIISDKFSKRETILNILKDDYSDFLPTIRKAVDDFDSEIAHYAATTITEVIEQFKTGEMEMRSTYKQSEKPEDALAYIDFVESFLEKKLLPDFEYRKYVLDLANDMNLIKEMHYEYFNIEACNRLIRLLMECQEYKVAFEWLEFLFQNYDEELDTYKSGLRFYQRTGRRDDFCRLLRKLKASNLILDAETLEWVRFFQV